MRGWRIGVAPPRSAGVLVLTGAGLFVWRNGCKPYQACRSGKGALGMLKVGLVLLMWGIWPIASKAALGKGATGGVTLLWSLMAATLVTGLWTIASGEQVTLLAPAAPAVVASGVALGVGMVGFMQLLRENAASTATGLTALYPMVTALLAWVLWKETLTPSRLVGIVLAIIAIVLLNR